jgi:hypothetical protein
MDLAKKTEATRHFGAEFLTWLLFRSTKGEGELKIGEEIVEVWFEDKVKMVSPIATKEVDLFKGKNPAHSKEAKEALRQGKVVEEANLVIIKGDDREWKLSFNAPRWTFSSVKIPALLNEEEDDRLIERFWLLEEIHTCIEELYKLFLEVRLDSNTWSEEIIEFRRWVSHTD